MYSGDHLKSLTGLRWISRVPLTIAQAQHLVEELPESEFLPTNLPGYRLAERQSDYGGIAQRWIVVESEARKIADLKRLDANWQQLTRKFNYQLSQWCAQDYRCEADALLAVQRFESQLKDHCLEAVIVKPHYQHRQPGRPRTSAQPTISYRIEASLAPHLAARQQAQAAAGRFVLATNVIDPQVLSAPQLMVSNRLLI